MKIRYYWMNEMWKTGISNISLHFHQTEMSARKNNGKETWTSLTRITLHQRKLNLVWIFGLNFQNVVSNSIYIWLFNSSQTFVQIKTKFFWFQTKKPPDNSALTVYSNVIHTNVDIYFRIYNEQKYFMVGFAPDFVGSSLIL